MKRLVLIVVTLAGCGDPDPRELGSCNAGAWEVNGDPVADCDSGCAGGPTASTDMDGDLRADECPSRAEDPRGCPFDLYVEFEGTRGCCVPTEQDDRLPGTVLMQFQACE